MGSIKNDEQQVVITLEIDKLLNEKVRMMIDGKLMTSTNTTMRDVMGWVLWSILFEKIPQMDSSKFAGSKIELEFVQEAGAIVANIAKH